MHIYSPVQWWWWWYISYFGVASNNLLSKYRHTLVGNIILNRDNEILTDFLYQFWKFLLYMLIVFIKSYFGPISLQTFHDILNLMDYDCCYILCMHPAYKRWRYIVTSSPIGWVHAQNDPCYSVHEHFVSFPACHDLCKLWSDNSLTVWTRQNKISLNLSFKWKIINEMHCCVLSKILWLKKQMGWLIWKGFMELIADF